MALADRILQLKLISDVSQVKKGMATVNKDMGRVQKAQGRVTSGFKSMGTAMIALGGITIAADFVGGAVNEFLEGEKAARDFERQIALTSQNVPADVARMNKAMAAAVNVGLGDDDYQRIATGLIRRLGVSVKRAIRIADIAVDLDAADIFNSPEEASNVLVKALRGSKKALDDLGVPMRARRNDATILAFPERKYGQAAEENARTLPGRWAVIQAKWQVFQADMVAGVVNLSDNFAQGMTNALGPDWIGGAQTALDIGLTAVTVRIVTAGAGIAQAAITLGRSIFGGVTDETAKLPSAVGEDMRLTQEALNQVNPILFRQRIAREVSAALALTERMKDGIRTDLDAISALWQAWKTGGVFSGVVKFLLPHVRELAEGGIVDKPTLALIGEKGPEAVVPPGGAGAAGWGGITINITTGVGDPVEIGRQVDRVLRAYRGRAGLAA